MKASQSKVRFNTLSVIGIALSPGVIQSMLVIHELEYQLSSLKNKFVSLDILPIIVFIFTGFIMHASLNPVLISCLSL